MLIAQRYICGSKFNPHEFTAEYDSISQLLDSANPTCQCGEASKKMYSKPTLTKLTQPEFMRKVSASNQR
jgi:hypothetical protein